MDFNKRKQDFIRWVLANYQHSNPSVNYLLQFLSSNKAYMPSIHFSEAVKYAPRGIYISYQNNSRLPFVYYKNKYSYTLSDQAFHDIRLNSQGSNHDYYIELNIPDFYKELYNFDIFEDNPYIPVDNLSSELLEDELQQISLNAKLVTLKQELDHALEKHNFEQASYIIQQIESLKGE